MAKYKLQELPDLNNTGKRKVYPKMVVNRTLSRKEFIERMQGYHRGISASTTEAVLMDVEEILVERWIFLWPCHLGYIIFSAAFRVLSVSGQ